MKIELGDRVRDRITGYEGIVIAITDWLYQCRRPMVQPSALGTNGAPVEAQSFDEDQLEVLERGAFIPKMPSHELDVVETGGSHENPSRHPDPKPR